ncbi:holo-ACP synthase [Campylobacter sp. LR291e]|uniref:holo-ACP synthase n=1 Tax=unclassified Campylobacter TaxID=2593542 RepID=UPI001237D596|nr:MULTISPECIES: holo-ACP synthase [unclassified Campylobacter]KAA6225241.1 holo-ACP synthase [Campylobacter sp. LR196d]KAA6226251.1 holo-ACP synthase [Campylobacter sp. LR185c]KAA6231453.1 holo-ACP synthase [Campylobacter sp. LR264d]KAA6231665.1 holo-ACP synthase [Campylobacter sp. LR291e]KAA8604755.1 holo-ACP synthase [Campylobacter sp. LR185c]
MKTGCDLVSINRIKRLHDNFSTKFLDKFLSKKEQKIIHSINSIAGFWAAKEALSKALGVGISKKCSFFDIRICKDKNGSPFFKFSKKLKKYFNIKSSSLSISHDLNFAMAVVVVDIKN